MRTLCALAFLALAGPVLAQAPAPAPADPFIGAASLGYLSTSGNTESTNANGSFKVTWDLDGPWKHDWTALAISAPTIMTDEMALVTLISGVCSAGVTDQTTK